MYKHELPGADIFQTSMQAKLEVRSHLSPGNEVQRQKGVIQYLKFDYDIYLITDEC